MAITTSTIENESRSLDPILQIVGQIDSDPSKSWDSFVFESALNNLLAAFDPALHYVLILDLRFLDNLLDKNVGVLMAFEKAAKEKFVHHIKVIAQLDRIQKDSPYQMICSVNYQTVFKMYETLEEALS